ncbi:MAG TPA: flippase-like domain-containing protein [Candidatus Latescibacteria bacterium]|nr:flippase-like domain-containing protein [Candidatus Latescibacterota bacterium]
MSITIQKSSISVGLRLFLILTLVGFTIVFYLTGTGKTMAAIGGFKAGYFLVALLLTLVDLSVGSLRIHIFIAKISNKPKRTSFWDCFRANLANIFLAAVTPFQTGGGVAQLYILHRAGIPVSGALSVSVVNFVATLFILLLAAIGAMAFMRGYMPSPPFRLVLSFSYVVFYIAAGLLLLFLIRPLMFGLVVSTLLRRIGDMWSSQRHRFHRLSERANDFIHQYRSYIGYYWRSEKLLLVVNLILTIILYFNKCLIGFVLIMGMDLDPYFLKVVAIQIILVFLFYFTPTPGASLIAETSTAALMSGLIPSYLLPVFALLWRFFTTYFSVIFGGVILLRELGAPLREKNHVRRSEKNRCVGPGFIPGRKLP